MLRFILHRFLLMIPTLLGVAVLVFFLLRLMPGDPVATMLLGDAGGANISKEVIDQERARLGLDQPLWVQFFKWMWGVLQGDFGVSMWTGFPRNAPSGIWGICSNKPKNWGPFPIRVKF